MNRIILFTFVLVSLLADSAAAQQIIWPEYPLPDDPTAAFRGGGGYLSLLKLIPVIGLFLLWVKTADWVNYDVQILRENHRLWNPVLFGSFVAAFLLFWLIPWFLLGFLLLLLAYAVPLGCYVVMRNGKVSADAKVLTPDHLKKVFSGGRAGRPQPKAADQGPPIELIPRGAASENDDRANLIKARQMDAFLHAKQLLADAINWRAEQAQMVFSAGGVNIRYQIDGVPRDHKAHAIEANIAALVVLKTLANMNVEDQTSQQQGEIDVEYNQQTYSVFLSTQGVSGGEAAILQIVRWGSPYKTLEDLGMRPKTIEQLKELLLAEKGIFVFSAYPGQGLTTTANIALSSTDRLMRDFVAIENQQAPEQDLENITQHFYDSAAQQAPKDVLPKLLRLEPQVIVCRDFVDAESMKLLLEEANDSRLIVTTIKSKDAAEAILRELKIGGGQKPFATALVGVLSQRFIRRLCDDCKQAYEPPPQLLQQLGLPADRVKALCRPPVQVEVICPTCRGVGYTGRTAIFELLVPDDTIRKIIATKPDLALLRKAARQAGMQNLQAQGVLMVAKGETSLEELKRVMAL
ncbi:MAG: ATPase, T2SS/T4P/T4SS family [Pirellulales bacterium]